MWGLTKPLIVKMRYVKYVFDVEDISQKCISRHSADARDQEQYRHCQIYVSRALREPKGYTSR